MASASFVNCTEGTNGDSPTNLTLTDISKVCQALASANAYTISDSITGEDKFGSAPVRDSYFVYGSTDLMNDLNFLNGVINKSNYPNQDRVLRPEFCSVLNTRWLLSSNGGVVANASMNGASVYYNTFVAMEAYACVDQDAYPNQLYYRPAMYCGPGALNAELGWKFADVPVVTNDAWVINLRCTRAIA